MDGSPRESGGSGVKRTEVQRSPEGQKSREPKPEGGAPNVLRVRHETKAQLDEWKQRSNKVGVRVSNIKTRVIEYIRVVLIYL